MMETIEFYISELKKAKDCTFKLSNDWGKIVQQFENECKDIHIEYHIDIDVRNPDLNNVYLCWDNDNPDEKWRIMVEALTTKAPGGFRKPFMQLNFEQKLAIIPYMDLFLKSFINYIKNISNSHLAPIG